MESKFFYYFSPYVVKEIKDIIDTQAYIINPLTNFNAAKTAYRINEVTACFSILVDFLNYKKIMFDKNTLSKDSNIVNDFLKN